MSKGGACPSRLQPERQGGRHEAGPPAWAWGRTGQHCVASTPAKAQAHCGRPCFHSLHAFGLGRHLAAGVLRLLPPLLSPLQPRRRRQVQLRRCSVWGRQLVAQGAQHTAALPAGSGRAWFCEGQRGRSCGQFARLAAPSPPQADRCVARADGAMLRSNGTGEGTPCATRTAGGHFGGGGGRGLAAPSC